MVDQFIDVDLTRILFATLDMSVKFYDEKEIQIENRLKDLNERVKHLQTLAPNDQSYLRSSAVAFAVHNDMENEEIGWTLSQAHLDAKVKVLVGITVGAITLWELVKGAGALYRWLKWEMKAEQRGEGYGTPSRPRLHARDWTQISNEE